MNGLERKLRTFVGQEFQIWAPHPVTVGGATLSIRFSAGLQTPAVAAVRTAVSVTDIGDDRRSLTVPAGTGAGSRGLIGDGGGLATLKLSEGGIYPVKVLRFSSDTVLVLADVLPSAVDIGTTGSISWDLHNHRNWLKIYSRLAPTMPHKVR